jgi:hypothetical protein
MSATFEPSRMFIKLRALPSSNPDLSASAFMVASPILISKGYIITKEKKLHRLFQETSDFFFGVSILYICMQDQNYRFLFQQKHNLLVNYPALTSRSKLF